MSYSLRGYQLIEAPYGVLVQFKFKDSHLFLSLLCQIKKKATVDARATFLPGCALLSGKPRRKTLTVGEDEWTRTRLNNLNPAPGLHPTLSSSHSPGK